MGLRKTDKASLSTELVLTGSQGVVVGHISQVGHVVSTGTGQLSHTSHFGQTGFSGLQFANLASHVFSSSLSSLH